MSAVLLGLVAAGLPAQDPMPDARAPAWLGAVRWAHGAPAAGETPRFVLWVTCPAADTDLADHAQYLADLQRRYADAGVRIAVALPPAAAAAVASTKPVFAVGALAAAPGADAAKDTPVPVGTFLSTGAGDELCAFPTLDGAVDVLQAAVDGKLAKLPVGELADLVPSLLDRVGDGGDLLAAAQHCATALPHCGRARALPVLVHWWCTGDVQAAHEAAEAGVRALGSEAVPLVAFADLVLRGDRNDPALAKLLCVSLAPAAAAAPGGAFTQLVYLRALLRAGQDRLAGRVAATLPKLVDGRPDLQIVFAETLMEAAQAAVFRDLADRALAAAGKGQADVRWLAGARHKVLSRCGAPAAEIDKVLADYRATEEFRGSDLNNDAWYLMVQPATMGRFDTLALAHCEELQRQQGAAISYGNKDTVALAMFLNGRVEQAIELETDAMKQSHNDPEYVGRLKRYENTLAAAKRRSQGTDR